MADIKPAIGYVRVNNPRAFTESERQRRNINAWAERTGHLMVGWVEDIWVPGTGGNEVALEELLTRVREGEASVIAVEEVHRISRHVDVVREWMGRVEQAGGRVEQAGREETG
ncbi:recombinase family protein [Streptomyces anulatus]|uniref:recombinase family protein n=1 Tax=Streptomyces anulatus TaxID=1892 RepID=UPI00386C3AF2